MGAIAVGVAGGTGSGKTTLTRALLERFGNRSTVLFMDNYYKAHVGKTFAQRAAQNFDAPEAFDVELLREQKPDLYNMLAREATDALASEKAKRSRRAKKASSPSPVVLDGAVSQVAEQVSEEETSWNG